MKLGAIFIKAILSIAFLTQTVWGQDRQPEVRPLPVNDTVTRPLKSGEVHFYAVDLKQGQVLQLDLLERGVNLSVGLFRAVGNGKVDKDSMVRVNFGFGYDRETLTVVVEVTATYVLLVGASDESALSGGYQLKAQVKEVKSAADEEKSKAVRLLAEGVASRNKGDAGDLWDAVAKCSETLPLWQKLGEKYWEGFTNNLLGRLYSDLGEKEKALDYYERALPLFNAVGDKSGEAVTRNNIGKVYSDLGDNLKALDYFTQALALRRDVGDVDGEAFALHNIGGAYWNLDDSQKALDYYNQAAPLFKALGDQLGEGAAYNNISDIYEALGEQQAALDYLLKSLPLAQAAGNKLAEGRVLIGIGRIYSILGEQRKAQSYYDQALALNKAVGDKHGEAAALDNMGNIYADGGDYQTALIYYVRALALQRYTGEKEGEARTLGGIGRVYWAAGDNRKALAYFNESLLLRRSIGDKDGEANSLMGISGVHLHLGEHQKALEYLNQVLLLRKVVGDRRGEADALSNMMVVWAKLNNRRMAIFYGKQAVNRYQELRGKVKSFENETQKTFLSGFRVNYKYLAKLLIDEGQTEQAVQILNLYQDQQFFDFNHGAKPDVRQVTLSRREQELAGRYEAASDRVRQTGSQLEDLKRRVGSGRPNEQEASRLQQLESELKTASDIFLTVLKDAGTEFSKPPDEKDNVGEVPDTAEMKASLRMLTAATKGTVATLYTMIGVDSFNIILVTPDGKVKAFESPVKTTDFNNKILRFYALLRSPKYDPRPLGKELYNIIFKPVEAELKLAGATTLMWSLDGSLRYVPVAALSPDGKGYLVQQYRNIVFTRADSERMTRTVAGNWTGVGFGNSQAWKVGLLDSTFNFPALPGVTTELQAIFGASPSLKGILAGPVFAGPKFTKSAFYEEMKARRPLVHIASHFMFRPGDDSRSFLLLGDGTALTLSELKKQERLFDGVELLTLSACNTAAQIADADGREIDGFAELSQRLGASAVLATLWPVADNSTPRLMGDFYLYRQQPMGTTKAEALRLAQLSLLNGTARVEAAPDATKGVPEAELRIIVGPLVGRRDGDPRRDTNVIHVERREAPLYRRNPAKRYAHPYYWAPFVLFGNWR